MNCGIDYRTDFYALGATAWHLMAGRPPFELTDPLALVHAHLALHPLPLHTLRPDVPLALSEVIQTLMAKHPEERYQSAQGILADLRLCLRAIEEGMPASFLIHNPLKSQDRPLRFTIPNRCYGRAPEIEILTEVFAQAQKGNSRILLVSGAAGMGKSSLVRELKKPVVQHQGYFTYGHFDLLHRETPYQAIIMALSALLRQLLSEDEAHLSSWQSRISEAIGGNGALLVPLMPDLAYFLKNVTEVPTTSPQETRNRFLTVFVALIRAMADSAHVLVLFLDDLQWADSASLELIAFLATDSELSGFLLVGTVRNDEIDDVHPLTRMLIELEEQGIIVQTLALKPLTLATVTDLIADACRMTPEEATALAHILLEKTDGNPFFLRSLLHRLHTDGLLYTTGKGWSYDLDAIRAVAFSDNVIQLMIDALDELPLATQNVLCVAACLGHRFDSRLLADICGQTLNAIAYHLQPALDRNLLTPDARDHRQIAFDTQDDALFHFAHDRIREAAYAMVQEADRATLHLKIGRLLIGQNEIPKDVQDIFAVVGHL